MRAVLAGYLFSERTYVYGASYSGYCERTADRTGRYTNGRPAALAAGPKNAIESISECTRIISCKYSPRVKTDN